MHCRSEYQPTKEWSGNTAWMWSTSLVPTLHSLPSEKWFEERSLISWTYFQKYGSTNDKYHVTLLLHWWYIALLLRYSKIVWRSMLQMLLTSLGYTNSKKCTIAIKEFNLVQQFFFLVRGWGLGVRLVFNSPMPDLLEEVPKLWIPPYSRHAAVVPLLSALGKFYFTLRLWCTPLITWLMMMDLIRAFCLWPCKKCKGINDLCCDICFLTISHVLNTLVKIC